MQVPGNLAKLPVTFDPMLGMTYAEALSLQETRGFEFFFFLLWARMDFIQDSDISGL